MFSYAVFVCFCIRFSQNKYHDFTKKEELVCYNGINQIPRQYSARKNIENANDQREADQFHYKF